MILRRLRSVPKLKIQTNRNAKNICPPEPRLPDHLCDLRCRTGPRPATDEVIVPDKVIQLFNGRDLSSFYTWLVDFHRTDPNQVFSVVDQVDGAPAIRISGQHYGGLYTKQRFANYRLVAEFRWGLATWGTRTNATKDSGVLLHASGRDGNYLSKTFNGPFPAEKSVPVWTPIRETFEHDWRVKVESPQAAPKPVSAPSTPAWNLNGTVKWLQPLSWLVTALLRVRLLVQSFRIQRWAWSLRDLTQAEINTLPLDLPFGRLLVSDASCTPCVAGWFFPIIAVPAKAFDELTPPQWRWLIRHETEHLRTSDTVAVLLQNIVLAFLWWNPFAHALVEEYARAREEACDAAAVGEEPDHTPYADFLLAWAGRPSPSRFPMTIARLRPARRLRDRLVALAEARGVRKKVGALFVLACLAFVMIAPLVVASRNK